MRTEFAATLTDVHIQRSRHQVSITTVREPKTTYRFILVFAGEYDSLSSELLDALFEAGCDDSHVSLSENVLRIAFDRDAPSFRIALLSAIADVERAGVGLELARVEPD
jgi:hypothetical protein